MKENRGTWFGFNKIHGAIGELNLVRMLNSVVAVSAAIFLVILHLFLLITLEILVVFCLRCVATFSRSLPENISYS